MPSTAPGSTSPLPFASHALPLLLLAPPPPTPFWILPGRFAALPFCGRRFPSLPSPGWRGLPWHPRPHHERLRRDLQGDEEGELQPETEDILSRGEFCKRTKSARSSEVNCQTHFLKCTISSTNIPFMPGCKLKCQETWWVGM